MALFGKKKKDKTVEETAAQAVETPEEAKEEKSDLDIIKEAMEEAKQERHTQLQNAAENAGDADMPTPEEIRQAQEILARAQAAQASQIPAGAKVGVNAPVNTASLKAVVNNFMQSKNQENMKRVMDCLQNPQTLVCVPAQIITSQENQEKMKQGGEVKLEGPIKINPVIFTDNTGKKLFPIFTGEDTIPDEIKSKTPKVNMPFGQCVQIISTLKDVDTFVLEPYTANIRIGVNANNDNK